MKFADMAEIIRQEIGEELTEKVCQALCRYAHHEQVYIPSKPNKPQVKPSDTPKDIQKRHGVSRSTAYNWVSSWRK